ncbi:DUF58 domain-containing protein [Mycolicibacterium sp.]|uniref:DUF58 domain-containing protein n=1 Tax=Mycolicibacterium sp. TaxID=2320850 RepID=UPI0028A86392|nr:DUF58 domain-containing protein [Mycolicibacterium sp.]
MVLTGRAAAAGLVAVLPIAVSPRPAWVFLFCAVLLAAAVAADAVLAGRPAGLDVRRTGPPSVRLGNSGDSVLQIRNDGSRSVRGLIRDAWPPSTQAQPRSHPLDLRPGGSATATTALRPLRRGDHHSAAVTVRSIGPLGLAGRQRSVAVPGTARVLPPFLSRKHLPSRLARLREIDGLLPALVRGRGTEFDSLREYVVGDDVRSIDWRATARRSDVVVRTWRPERDRRVVIVVDSGRTSAGRVGVDPTARDPGGWPRLDWSLDAALLLAALAARAGDHVDFLAHDRVTRAAVVGAGRTELLAELVTAMAPLEPALVESDSAAMVATVLRRVRRRALVVLLTDLNSSALEDGLLPVLGRLTARHQVLLAAVSDPRIADLAAGRSDVAQVYDAAAAERSRNDRRDIAARLRNSGVEVIDAVPDELAPALADRYLGMKAAGRL